MEEKVAETKKPLRKTVKQRNHDSAVIPADMRDYADQPLYLLVALWCNRQSDWIDRQQISLAFGITPRRASFQISYILRQGNVIESSCRKVRTGFSGHFRQEIRIHQVHLERVSHRKASSRSKSSRKGCHCQESQEHWRWVLTRPAGETK